MSNESYDTEGRSLNDRLRSPAASSSARFWLIPPIPAPSRDREPLIAGVGRSEDRGRCG